MTSFILIFDADNTLWDTNAIFTEAQQAMLKEIAKLPDVSLDELKLETLRSVDRTLYQLLDQHEYDFQKLAQAIIYYAKGGLTVSASVEKALATDVRKLKKTYKKAIDRAVEAHTKALKAIPPLLPNVESVLVNLREVSRSGVDLARLIFSEGNVHRIKNILNKHKFYQHCYFDEIIIAPKKKDVFENVRSLGLCLLRRKDSSSVKTILVGDSMKRDIRPANEAGMITVYVPSGFKGQEIPEDNLDQPDYQISHLGELLEVLHDLGLPILSNQ